MHALFDRVDKTILGRALSLLGAVHPEHEIAADAQRADTSFQPAPGREAQRARMGLFGRVAVGPCLFEIFHGSLGLYTFDDCVRKQLTLGHVVALEAKKSRKKRPAKPRLWVLSAGRPVSVLRGYEMRPLEDFPRGFYRGATAAATFVVAIRELPRDRQTLFFRLFGAGEVLALALQDLAAMPPDAWEREAAVEPLVALRIQIPETDADDEERRFLMATQDLYEQWKQRMVQQGLQQGARQTAAQGLIAAYEARFGAVPVDLRAAMEKVAAEAEEFPHWIAIVTTSSQQEIAAALLSERSVRPRRRPSSVRRPGAGARRR